MWIDIALVLVILAGCMYGYNKGLVQTIFSILGIFVGFIAILKVAPIIIQLLRSVVSMDPGISFIIGIAISCLLVVLLLRAVKKLLGKATKTPVISTVNKGLGAIALAVFFSIGFSFIVWFLDKSGVVSPDTKQASVTYPYLQGLPSTAQDVMGIVQPIFGDLIDEAKRSFQDFRESDI